ncbi:MAG TPA: PTS sugar transporter subunit IIA [Thermoanaerobaculia bacterium]|nr:PTS sugar transporter subunit IIA [Thermoanaerobaculia bacterium]
MTRVLILTQGNLAQELLKTAQTIAGAMPSFSALGLDWSDTIEEGVRKTRALIDQFGSEDEVLILTDIFGGTPSNVALTLHHPGRIEVVSGVNLPMVVRLGCSGLAERGVTELARWIQKKGQASICRRESPPGCGEEGP